ncbi:MAG: LacI family DNA-binding transcriptional regulator [Bryobacteraceae bacterium]
MPLKKEADEKRGAPRQVSLRELAKNLGLSPTTLSLVLNRSSAAGSIPQDTKDRIFAAAKKSNYRPNFLARSLRSRRTYTIGVIAPEWSEGYSALVLAGVEDFLMVEGYMYLVTSHHHQAKLIDQYPRLLYERQVEGLIAVDTPFEQQLPLPVVSVSGHRRVPGVTNIVLNHERAAELGLRHLTELGHKKIAFFRGQSFSSDTEVRWEAIRTVATQMGVAVRPALVTQMDGEKPSPEVGYMAAKRILAGGEPFTALFAFNDISAIGAIRAFRESGLRIPEDVSVMGFDDVYGAAFHIPALTTIRQPLWQMGKLAAETLLKRIGNTPGAEYPEFLEVEPELIVRESSARAHRNGIA